MRKIIRGLQKFKDNYYTKHIELFQQLTLAQKPRVLFVTCADSRIVPSLITQTEIGELFIIRNAGNIIPPFGAGNTGEGATIEYAIHSLEIEQVIICGHSHCGAIKALLQLNRLQEEMPLMFDWLKYTAATHRLVRENYSNFEGEQLLEILIAENVLTQIENLKTYPVVRSRLFQGKLQIFGWIYHLETGEVLAYDPVSHSYIYPHTQIDDDSQEDGHTPGQYVRTSLPLACKLPKNSVGDGFART